MNWSLLPIAARFLPPCCPASTWRLPPSPAGFQFPSWLNQNSKRSKIDRILSEVQGHTRLSAGSARRHQPGTRPEAAGPPDSAPRQGGRRGRGAGGGQHEPVQPATGGPGRLLEVTQWPRPEPFSSVDSKTKAASPAGTTRSRLRCLAAQTTVTKKAGG